MSAATIIRLLLNSWQAEESNSAPVKGYLIRILIIGFGLIALFIAMGFGTIAGTWALANLIGWPLAMLSVASIYLLIGVICILLGAYLKIQIAQPSSNQPSSDNALRAVDLLNKLQTPEGMDAPAALLQLGHLIGARTHPFIILAFAAFTGFSLSRKI